ncbi:MAG: hypothetical protein ACFCVE_10395 [Phycisphaerae bacterium]
MSASDSIDVLPPAVLPPAATPTDADAHAGPASGVRPGFRAVIEPGLHAVRRNWRGMLLIQALAAAAVAAYYFVPATGRFFAMLAELNQRFGVFYALVAAVFAGAVLPEVAKAVTRPDWRLRGRAEELAFNVCFFAYVGPMVYVFYGALERFAGAGNDVGTIATKVAIDMLLFTPFWALPAGLALFDWRLAGYRWRPVVASLGPRWYRDRVVPVMVPNLVFWLPMVCLIYALPGPLQLVLWTLAMAAWSLVLVFLSNRET